MGKTIQVLFPTLKVNPTVRLMTDMAGVKDGVGSFCGDGWKKFKT